MMRRVVSSIMRKERFFADLTAERDSIPKALPVLEKFASKLEGAARDTFLPAMRTGTAKPSLKKSEGFTTAGQVQFVCRAGDFRRRGLPFRGELRVLKVILGYDYLWNKVRVFGGAYGCMSGFGRDGISYFVSYRDPKLKETVQAFEEAAAYIGGFEADEQEMTKYVIGAVSTMDRPMTPSMFGRFSKTCELTGITAEDLQRERQQVLSCTQEEIRRMSAYIEAFLDDGVLCVVGSAKKLKEEETLFDTLEPLT